MTTDSSNASRVEPIRGALGATILGPRNQPIEVENPTSMAAPLTDSGTVPNLKYSFAAAHNRVLTGGWAREVTTRELPVAVGMAGGGKAVEARGAPPAAGPAR